MSAAVRIDLLSRRLAELTAAYGWPSRQGRTTPMTEASWDRIAGENQ